MKFGVREICDVVLKAKANQKVGNKIFYKNEPVIYFDTLKTSSMEGAATTVYAQGGRGNSRLVAWEGERTVTFTMEDALISAEGFMILSGAGLIEANSENTIKVHRTERIELKASSTPAAADTFNTTSKAIQLSYRPYDKEDGDYIYVMVLDNNGDVIAEPRIYTLKEAESSTDKWIIPGRDNATIDDVTGAGGYNTTYVPGQSGIATDPLEVGKIVLVDYYTEEKSMAQQIEITPDKFGGNYYLEASTLFRDTNGVDLPAEFIIPNCKIQSNFTFTMASSGDPSSFTFTMDAFPDYTRFDKTKKVLAAIQILGTSVNAKEMIRESTNTGRDWVDLTNNVEDTPPYQDQLKKNS